MIAAGGYQPRCQAYPHRIELVGFYDQDEARASALAERNGGRVYKSLDEVLNDPNVEAIVNLTLHISHYPVSLAALKAGKHVYSEKPISIRTDEANELVETAEAMGVKTGVCAISDFLGMFSRTSGNGFATVRLAMLSLRSGTSGVPWNTGIRVRMRF